jgi:tRNA(Ile)-lysidine synthase
MKSVGLVQEIDRFLQERFVPGRPLILGFSGGEDSSALLDLLLHFPLDLHLAHVDHGWRKESAAQAEALKKKSALPFHLHTSRIEDRSEDAARQERLSFFQDLYRKLGAQALILGHHADDLAETVLKRIFEGAALYRLGAMSKISDFEGMVIWRPLLDVSKKELTRWREARALKAIHDETNGDPCYLRGRLRTQILPGLAKQFGKEVAGNLVELGKRSSELEGYLARKTAHLLAAARSDQLDLTPFFPLEEIELRFALKEFLEGQGLFFARAVLKQMAGHLEKKSKNRTFGSGVIVDGGIIKIKNRD